MHKFALASLCCLFSAGLAVQAVDDGKPKGGGDGGPVIDTLPPTITSPKPGSTIGSDVEITGSSTCLDLIFLVTNKATGVTTEYPWTAPSRIWKYKLRGVTSDVSIIVCCKKAMPPHGPCSGATDLKFSVEPPIGGTDEPGGGRTYPTFPAGRVVLNGFYHHKDPAVQSVYVVLENEIPTNEKLHRSQAAKAELTKNATDLKKSKWQTCFSNVGPGRYVVRLMLMSITSETIEASYVIEVLP